MPAPRDRRRGRRSVHTPRQRVTFWAAAWVVLYALWLLLVFKTELLEFLLGAAAAAVAATAAELVRSRGYAPFSADPRWLLALPRLPVEVAVDTWLLAKALVLHLRGKQRLQGVFRVVHFEGCAGDDPRSEGRRAAAKWIGGIAPNGYVIGFDENRDLVLVHQLVATERPPDVDPGAPRR